MTVENRRHDESSTYRIENELSSWVRNTGRPARGREEDFGCKAGSLDGHYGEWLEVHTNDERGEKEEANGEGKVRDLESEGTLMNPLFSRL